ncbi:glycosyltransferase family 2 protein [Gemmatimonas sp.]|jgi:glycosyltransferase involved in cell wall biosynthesis|uniref:glycosyltransferase family 2 protein n=1 Tax=Gemmatimonas sp. TaxID=1962908 RepID=UPI0025BA06D0|nr:glycosyltransferase family 2 protein [Gemmatimonas sp.]MCA2991433.1 glycosyltransferase family 2 protein [Gemmatimonas sp.]
MTPPTASPLATVVVLCRNEAGYIERCVASLLANRTQYPNLEILVVDGMSDDGTRDLLAAMAAREDIVRLVDNPQRTTPAAFNVGIRAARGSIILPVGAHCEYPTHYCATLIARLLATGADNVGGHCRTVPGAETWQARGIAVALSHPLGVGNALFRLSSGSEQWVDTVPFGCYRRHLFDRIGYFDEELLRNQDDEFNHRLKRSGGRILLVPDVEVLYVARSTYRQLARMFWQYGLYKPLAASKLGAIPTMRQLVPPAFVLAVVAGAAAALLWPQGWFLLAAVLSAYTVAVVSQALPIAVREGAGVALGFACSLPIMHVGYGTGWLTGAVRLLRRGPSSAPREDLGLSR